MKLNLKYKILQLLKFNYHWLIYFKKILVSIFFNKNYQNETILRGTASKYIYQNNDINIYLKWIQEGPVKPLNNLSRVIILDEISKTKILHYNGLEVVITNDPIYEVLLGCKISIIDFLRLIASHILIYFIYLFKSFLFPEILLLEHEISMEIIIRFLSKKEAIKDIFYSQGDITEIPMSSVSFKKKTFNSHMLWYSTNSKLFSFKREDHGPIYDPTVFCLHVDNHWMWTEGEINWAKGTVNRKVNFIKCDPILYAVTEIICGNDVDFDYNIAVFDVVPILDNPCTVETLRYYRYEVLERFYFDILNTLKNIEATSNKKFNVFIKSKKKLKDHHDYAYMSLLTSLGKLGVNIQYVDTESNVVNLINRCNVIISIPFTSPGKIGSIRGKNSFYYDPTESVYPNIFDKDEVDLVKGRQNLQDKLEKLLKK